MPVRTTTRPQRYPKTVILDQVEASSMYTVQQGGARYAPSLVFIRAGWYVPHVPAIGIGTDGPRPTEGPVAPVTRVRTAVFTAEYPAT